MGMHHKTRLDHDAQRLDAPGWLLLSALYEDQEPPEVHPGVVGVVTDLGALDGQRVTDYGVELLEHREHITSVAGACQHCGSTQFTKAHPYTNNPTRRCSNCSLLEGAPSPDPATRTLSSRSFR